MAARSASKVQQAIEGLRSENPSIESNQISWLKLDIADLRSISEAAAQLKSKEVKLDILGMSKTAWDLRAELTFLQVNNAAAPGTALDKLSSGWEPHIGTE